MTRSSWVACECCGEPLALPPAQPAPSLIEAREWNGHPIHRRQVDGYVNATAMCRAGGKRWNHYQVNDRTQAYIHALAADAGIPATGNPGLICSIQGGRPELQGTWIHPRLAVDLARWISPAFAVWMDGWFLEQFQPPASPTTTNQPETSYRGFLGNSPRIVIHAASDQEAADLWLQAVSAAVLGGLARNRRRALHAGGSPRYEVAITR
jgi:KilA-N domain